MEMSGRAPLPHTRPTIDILIEIWEKVLCRSPVSPDDNFFDLGGDSVLAVALFLAIEEATGETLPITAIYDAPTVATLAQALESLSPARSSPLVLLKQGDDAPPVFMAPGVGGRVMYLSRLARGLSTNRPVYAVEGRGLDGAGIPDDRVEDMAEYCLQAVQGRQPHGPYLLAGHSLGGLVMLEVAQRLLERGEEIALLAFFDTYPHPQFWRLSSWLPTMLRCFAQYISAATKLNRHDVFPYLLRRCENLAGQIRARYRGVPPRQDAAANGDMPDDIRAALDRNRVALSRYRPRFYPGKITFLKAETVVGLTPADPAAVWGRLTRSLEIHTIPGDHIGMLTGESTGLRRQFSRCLERALVESSTGAVRTPMSGPVGPGGLAEHPI
jgi:thioesterase domain-containing protein/acyl carrier protein